MSYEIKSVLVADAVDKLCPEILKKHGIEVVTKTKLTKAELLEEIKKHDALVVRSATQVTEDVLKAGNRLKVVGRAGAGVDNIDMDVATKRKILVLNAPGANALSACEMTCALMLAVARNVPQAAASMRAGRWDRAQYAGGEIYGKTLAVIGLGRVGREVAMRMNTFGMKVIGFDPLVNEDACRAFNTTKMELEEIWPQADYITLHVPLIASTKNLISAEVLKKCKSGVKIINVARGGLIDEEALLDNLNSGHVGGAALDVFEEEPPTDNLTLEVIKHPKVVATPHLGASTKEAQVRVAVEVAEQFVNLMKPGTFATPLAAVNKIQ